MPEDISPQSSLILYQTEDGLSRIQCRFDSEAIWLTQAQIAERFDTTPPNVTSHLKAKHSVRKPVIDATCKDYLQVRNEGGRTVSRFTAHRRRELEAEGKKP